jgi:hypothetical protein
MKNPPRQDGVAQLLIIALVVVVAGVIGLALWQSQQAKPKPNEVTSLTKPSPVAQASSTPVPTATTYLTITQWGAQIPLTDDIKDAIYAPDPGQRDGNTMLVSLKSLDSSTCSPTPNHAIGLIFRASPTDKDEVSGDFISSEYPNAARIGSYIYAYVSLANGSQCQPANAAAIDKSLNAAVNAASAKQ